MASDDNRLPGVPLKEALSNARGNEFARVLGRTEPNRIEPECWPVVKPGFEFSKDQKFFTIGSCFAANIGERLAIDGYNVHGEGDQKPRYTPPAIFQEIEWAGKIFHRDGKVRQEDVEPILIESPPGLYSDLWSRPGKEPPADMETAIERRKAVYNWLRGAFEADVAVITLGLIEAWYDSVSNSYVEFDGSWIRRKDRDRFRFEVLSFEKCKEAVRKTLELLLDGKRRVLMTTSPVVLARTFTDKDIIVANNYSKSVLRAVAGEVTDQLAGVDYFPSYEIATISGRQQVWDDDLRHVKPNFVARIMQHVTNAYVPASVTDAAKELMHMANLVDAGEFQAAASIFDRHQQAAEDSDDYHVHLAAIKLARSRDESATAMRHALWLDRGDDRQNWKHPNWMFEAARVMSASEQYAERAREIFENLKETFASRPNVLLQFLIGRERARDEDGIQFVADIVESSESVDPAVVRRTVATLEKAGRTKQAVQLCKTQLTRRPDNEILLALYARLMLRDGRSEDALSSLRKLGQIDPESEWVHLALARAALAHADEEEALQAVNCHLNVKPDDTRGLTLKARILTRMGLNEEARASARAAVDASGGDPQVKRNLHSVIDAGS